MDLSRTRVSMTMHPVICTVIVRHPAALILNVNGFLPIILLLVNPVYLVDLVIASNVGNSRVTPQIVIVSYPVLIQTVLPNVWKCDATRTITEMAVCLIVIVSGLVPILDAKLTVVV